MLKQVVQKHIVVITDDSIVERSRMKRSLDKASDAHIDVYEAESKEDILNLMERLDDIHEFPSVIVLDFVLGASNGLTVARHLRKNFPPVPIIVLGTCIGSEDNITSLYRLGVNAYMVKPQTQEDYDKVIQVIADVWLHVPQPRWGERKETPLSIRPIERRQGKRRDYDRRAGR